MAIEQNTVTIQFARTRVVLPPQLAKLVIEHLAARPTRGFADGQSQWVFEGMQPGQHLTAAYVRYRLTEINLSARVAYTTRLDLLAQTLSASVISDTIGVSPETASRWRGMSGGAWSTYPTLRSE